MAELVSVNRCRSYEGKEVAAVVDAAFTLLERDGVASLLRGSTVLIKPNLLGPSAPATAVTTHPEFVRAVIEVLKQFTPRIIVGDSPGFGSCAQAAQVSGIAAVCRETGVQLGSFSDTVEIHHPEGRVCKKFEVAREVAEADVMINLPKLKTHRLTGISCAVKNVFGCIPGLRKTQYHMRMPELSTLSAMLVDLCEAVRPTLTLVDAIVAMEGNGPRHHGTPREAGLVIAGTSPYAVDMIACAVTGMEPAAVTTITVALEAGIGPFSAGEVDVRGLSVSEARVPGFRQPSRRESTPAVYRVFRGYLTQTPRIAASRCRRCSICVEVCPAKAIRSQADRAPTINYSKCIRCYCCEEMCPHGAVDISKPPLSKLLHWRFH